MFYGKFNCLDKKMDFVLATSGNTFRVFRSCGCNMTA